MFVGKSNQPLSVIEEKGEGFEKRKNRFSADCGLAFNLSPPIAS
ncbi:MAG: hypothetical protein QHH18_05645 [Candidatus Bathyarchaeota archaeon]|nr:hypothetical protein [Candidatus Bathyarchaeota archaeon]